MRAIILEGTKRKPESLSQSFPHSLHVTSCSAALGAGSACGKICGRQ